MAARCATEAFSTTCAVHIEDCEGWWFSGCCGSVAEHWRLKPEVSWVRLPVTAGFFTFLYFRLITSKFIYFQREARCSVRSIDQLGSSNWITWKFQMQHYWLSKDKYVDGTEVLAEGATDATQRTFRDNSQKALSTIAMAISTSQLYLVTSCESSRDIWD